MGGNHGDEGDFGDGGIDWFCVRWCRVMAQGVVVCGVGLETVVVGDVVGVLVGDADGVMDGESFGIDNGTALGISVWRAESVDDSDGVEIRGAVVVNGRM